MATLAPVGSWEKLQSRIEGKLKTSSFFEEEDKAPKIYKEVLEMMKEIISEPFALGDLKLEAVAIFTNTDPVHIKQKELNVFVRRQNKFLVLTEEERLEEAKNRILSSQNRDQLLEVEPEFIETVIGLPLKDTVAKLKESENVDGIFNLIDTTCGMEKYANAVVTQYGYASIFLAEEELEHPIVVGGMNLYIYQIA